jgi:hypothetical protein
MNIHPLWYICLLSRFTLSLILYFSKNVKSIKISKFLSIILLIMGTGFIYKAIYSSNSEIQIAKVFWHETRIIHAVLYILAGIYLYNDKHMLSSILVILDILFSITYRVISNK